MSNIVKFQPADSSSLMQKFVVSFLFRISVSISVSFLIFFKSFWLMDLGIYWLSSCVRVSCPFSVLTFEVASIVWYSSLMILILGFMDFSDPLSQFLMIKWLSFRVDMSSLSILSIILSNSSSSFVYFFYLSWFLLGTILPFGYSLLYSLMLSTLWIITATTKISSIWWGRDSYMPSSSFFVTLGTSMIFTSSIISSIHDITYCM